MRVYSGFKKLIVLPTAKYFMVIFILHTYAHIFKNCCGCSTLRDPTCIPEEGMAEGGVSVGMFGDGGQWLRFNDVLVDEFNMTNQTLEAECFGGTYKPKPTESQCTYKCM